jgi:DNA-binding NarL/FixJ family response regulator
MAIRLILTDDHPLVLKGLSQLCAEEDDLEIVAECTDGESTLAALARHEADVLVLDLRLPRGDGFYVMEEIRRRELDVRVVLLTGNIADEDVLRAMRLGARGIVLKEMAPAMLVQCIRKVNSGGQWLERDSVGRALDKMLQREEAVQKIEAELTPREREVLSRVLAGRQNGEIAIELGIAEGTVKTHLHSIYDKLDVRGGRVQLMIFAREKGLT